MEKTFTGQSVQNIKDSGEPKNKKDQTSLSTAITIIVTLIGIVYLVAIPLNNKMGRLGTTEAIIFAVILLVNSGVMGRLAEFSFGGLVFKLRGVEEQQKKQQEEIKQQQEEIKQLRFLIRSVLSDDEVRILQKLAGEIKSVYDYDYNRMRELQIKLRRLRGLGLLTNTQGPIKDIPLQGDLKNYCRITPEGHDYLRWRKEEIESVNDK